MSPPYLSICGIYLSFQVNLYVPNSKPSNEILFCMLEQLMYQLGLSVSSMLGGLFSRGVDSAPHSRENGWSPGCLVPCSNQIKIIKQSSPRIVASWMHPLFRASHGLMLVGGGGVYTLPFCLGTAYNVCSMEDIEISQLLCWQWKYTAQSVIHLYFKIEIWHLYKSLLPSAKGLSIYFYVESSPSYWKAPPGEHRCHLHALLLVYIGYGYDWISFTMNYNV